MSRCHLFGVSIENQQTAFHHYRFYGSILLILLGIIVFLGIRFVSRIGNFLQLYLNNKNKSFILFPNDLAPFTLLIVLLSILSIFVGIFRSTIVPINLPICIIEKDNLRHLLKSSILNNRVLDYCHSNHTCDGEICPLRQIFCFENRSKQIQCNDLDHVKILNGISGLSYSRFVNNLKSLHMNEGQIRHDLRGDAQFEVVSKATTSFFILGKCFSKLFIE